MANRRNLDSAHQEKKDEFFTQYEDVEREINAFLDFDKDTFKDMTVLCPCDDSDESSFTKYFTQNFDKLGLKKLICTSYAHISKYGNNDIPYNPSPLEKLSPHYNISKSPVKGKAFILERSKDNVRNDFSNLQWEYLDGDGDFRSDELVRFRDESDVIITNPPFSLFREFVLWIIEKEKKFLILGNQNSITYKEVYPLIKKNQLWLGNRFNERVNGKNLTYKVPNHYVMKASELYIDESGDKYITVPGTGWFTNLDHGKRHQPLMLMTMANNLKFSKHSVIREGGYPRYDNYDAIEIAFVDAIPSDYDGYMGVPITFLGKYDPEQFEIITFRKGDDGKDLSVNGVSKYFRIIIRRRK
jgi:hypothetical protein